jgi:hypothetical protein
MKCQPVNPIGMVHVVTPRFIGVDINEIKIKKSSVGTGHITKRNAS